MELEEKYTIRTDMEIAAALAALVMRLLARGAETTDERVRPPAR